MKDFLTFTARAATVALAFLVFPVWLNIVLYVGSQFYKKEAEQ